MSRHNKRRLDDILISGLLDKRGSGPSILHKIMQISAFAFVDSRKNVYFASMEQDLRYTEPGLRNDNNIRWSADILLKYRENGKNIAEIIETETINLMEYWMRIDRINNKYEIVEKIAADKDENRVLQDADEIRFSIAVNCQDMKKELMDVLIRGFSNDFQWQRHHLRVVPYNLYVLKKNLYNYCPTDINSSILDSSLGVKGQWKSALRAGLRKIYLSLYKNHAELDSLYSEVRIR
ncbi:hypothetical protein M1293_00605 [Candidatus Parvarchaeota archaeon]|nr:hypothetical protein [Candidatus Parvarchaeota archaeon]